MTIGKKIGVCFASIVGLCLVVGAVGWVTLNAMGSHLDRAIGVTAKKVELAGEIRVSALTFRLQNRGMQLFSTINAPEQFRVPQLKC